MSDAFRKIRAIINGKGPAVKMNEDKKIRPPKPPAPNFTDEDSSEDLGPKLNPHNEDEHRLRELKKSITYGTKR